MNCLTKPHCKISARAHNIARHVADSITENDTYWRTVYRNVYEAAFNEGDGVPAWLCAVFIIRSTAAGYLVGRIQ